MSNSETQLYVHVTWLTKNRIEFLKEKAVLDAVLEHIQVNAIKKKIQIVTINGVADHIHLLLRLTSIETLARTMMLIKGESSWWIHKNLPGMESFQWQPGYHVRAIPEEQLDIVNYYIQNQENHHTEEF